MLTRLAWDHSITSGIFGNAIELKYKIIFLKKTEIFWKWKNLLKMKKFIETEKFFWNG
jgi:hypothetical protein